MPPQATLGTLALSEHLHVEKLCPLCILLPILTSKPHVVQGPVTSGSPNVLVNGKPAARVTDQGIAVPCCNANTFMIMKGSATVFINGLPAARIGDLTQHCMLYPGQLALNGSINVNVGDTPNQGGGPGRGGGSSSDDGTDDDGSADGAGQGSDGQGAGPGSTAEPSSTETRAFVELELVDDDLEPVPHERYRVIAPNGELLEGTLDDRGFARLDGLTPGECQVSFPDLHGDDWSKV